MMLCESRLTFWNSSGSIFRSRTRAQSRAPGMRGGDKLGVSNRLFYEKMVLVAEGIWEQYLREQGRERKGKR